MMHFVALLLVGCLAFACAAGEFGWDDRSLKIDGKRAFLVSGECHYFRIPKDQWRDRLRKLKAVGGNCVATYVPWLIHEPEEGNVLFGDCPERDLDGFLKMVKEEGLLAIVRPGPYQYSELVYGGLPKWLIEGHPEIAMRKKDGSRVALGSVDYNHPYFLAKTRTYFKAVAEVLRPHMAANGGCVAMVQLDNELTGIHVWFGYDNRTAVYYERCADYLATLRGYLQEFGIGGPYCHNSGGALMCSGYAPCVRRLGTDDFLMGYDHYYNLGGPNYAYSPDPTYFIRALFACDVMRSYGYPPVGFEIQAGTIGDYPPILKEDLLACHMANLAAGMKGVNYYVFAGGPNIPGTGLTVDVYDYSAPVSAKGEMRPTYESLKTFGGFLASHPQLLDAERLSSVRIGFEWTHFCGCARMNGHFFWSGAVAALMRSSMHPQFFLLEGELDLSKPLLLAGIESMSAPIQRKVADFVSRGGKLLVVPDFPRHDHEGRPCTLLADAVCAPKPEAVGEKTRSEPVCLSGDLRVYELVPKSVFTTLPEGAKAILTSEDGEKTHGCAWSAGKGRVAWLAATWLAKFNLQSDMLANALKGLSGEPVAVSANRNVLVTAYRLADGKTGVFALNLMASPQSTEVSLPERGSRKFDLRAMEVNYEEW